MSQTITNTPMIQKCDCFTKKQLTLPKQLAYRQLIDAGYITDYVVQYSPDTEKVKIKYKTKAGNIYDLLRYQLKKIDDRRFRK